MKLNTNSNAYTIIYASVVVIIVAFLLAFVSSALASKQQKNVELDTKKQILSALNLHNEADVDAAYNKYITNDFILNEDGTLSENADGFTTEFEKDAKEKNRLHVFQAKTDDGQIKYILPVYGSGLWGAIWGYVAVNEDKNTVYGTYFSHASETPGLGAEIATEAFQQRFADKKVMKDGEVGLSVVKKVADETYEVNGITGGTMTSNGVDAMLKNCLSNYKNFLQAGAAPAADEAVEEAETAKTGEE